MKEKLKQLLSNSYSPYSNFKVAAIVTMKDKKEFCGVNVENASYGATICAERSAIVSAISNGYKIGDFDSISIMVDSEEISTCCFLCRQVLVEFFDKDSFVTCYNNKGESKTYRIGDLCPSPFSKEDLK